MVLHGIEFYLMVLHCILLYCIGIELYCIGIAWYCMVLHGIALYITVSHIIVLNLTVLHCTIVGFGARAVLRMSAYKSG